MNWDLILTISLRLLLALALGFAIGFERKMRFKEAGMRTHTIVCLGSCLYMLISLFAFQILFIFIKYPFTIK
jgi:putative Mg2+ transporter-C (MgtC) family protein